MERQLIEKVIDEAREEGASLVIWDRRDTFTVESDDVKEIEANDDYLRVKMQDGKAIVYVEYDYIYKLVVERDRSVRAGVRAGFGASSSESAGSLRLRLNEYRPFLLAGDDRGAGEADEEAALEGARDVFDLYL